jgi:predicted dehydrogenase
MTKKIIVLGTAHAHVFGIAASIPGARDCELVGVWDEDTARRAAAAEKLGAPAFDSLDEALGAEPDLALIAAVPCDRAGLARRVIEAGGAALADKPLAVTHEELDRSIEAVERFGGPILTYYPYRGEPALRAAKEALDDGRIGKLVRALSCGPHKLNPSTRPDWHWTRAGNGGCMIDVGSHHADIVCHMAGETPDFICAVHTNVGHPEHPEFQDFAQAQLRFPSGVVGHVEADWCTPESMKHFGDTRTWIQGTTGKIEVRLGDVKTHEIWTQTEAAKPLDMRAFPDVGQWTSMLIEDLCHDRDCGIEQRDIWRASRVSLHAFDSAEAGGKAIPNPKF